MIRELLDQNPDLKIRLNDAFHPYTFFKLGITPKSTYTYTDSDGTTNAVLSKYNKISMSAKNFSLHNYTTNTLFTVYRYEPDIFAMIVTFSNSFEVIISTIRNDYELTKSYITVPYTSYEAYDVNNKDEYKMLLGLNLDVDETILGHVYEAFDEFIAIHEVK